MRGRGEGGYVLRIIKQLIFSIWWWFWSLKNSGNRLEILLSVYFTDELQ